MPAPASAPPAQPAAASIERITLALDCHGCANGTRLELWRQGTAMLTTTGKARHGTEDRSARAALPAAEFERLVQQLLTAGFFGMAPVYEAQGIADGAWAVLTVAHGGGEHQVFRREEAGPAALHALQAALQALQARLQFGPQAP